MHFLSDKAARAEYEQVVQSDRMVVSGFRTTARASIAIRTLSVVLSLTLGVAWLPTTIVVADEGASETPLATVEYNRDVRPILADTCFACHGADSGSREAGLRLDVREDAISGGAIVAGDPDNSEMIRRILLPDDDDMAMPPNTGHKRLTQEQRDTLVAWIQSGADYQAHWSFMAPVRSELPEVSDASWARNGIDPFIMAELDKVGLAPAEEADRRTLARRAALDLTGLPPTIEEVEAFVADAAPEAYERYVDRLLDSKRYGEHRGRYWLDYARFGDTHGIHFDNYREMWSYRDWVINAFNRNLAFDQFTIEQLAGDLLPEPTLDQLIATGFNRCNITTNEGGVIAEEYKVLYARDRTETTSLVWLALTTGCAVCHDHKFDPISANEFYSLSAFFNNTTQPVMDGNVPNTPPVIPVPTLSERERFVTLKGEIGDAQRRVDEIRGQEREQFDANIGSLPSDEIADTVPETGLLFRGLLGEGAGPAASVEIDGKSRLRMAAAPLKWAEGHVAPAALELAGDSVLDIGDVGASFEHDSAFSYGAWIYTPANASGSVLARMNEGANHRGFDLWLEGSRVGAHVIHEWPKDAIKAVTQSPLEANRWHHVFITYDGSGDVAGLQIYVNGKLRNDRQIQATQLTGTIRTEVPTRIGARSVGSSPQGVRVNDLRVYDGALSADDVSKIAVGSRGAYLTARPAATRSPEQTEELFAWWLDSRSPAYFEATAGLAALSAEEAAIRARGTIAHVMNEQGQEAEAFVLSRGEYDQRGERVTANVPAVFPAMSDDLPRNRLGLAQWLVRDDHPLTARVTVNRFWQEVFGIGLVGSSGDFGITGDLPSHPELLDWMAIDFRESGWDVKRLIRMMVTSATYRQSARTDQQKVDIDPENRLFARGPRFRMDAEMIRDYGLQTSGLLSAKIGGPSVKPYQPEGVWEAVAMIGSNTRDYRQDEGENLYRRSLYTFWKRSAPPASMDIFNAPSREFCTVRRDRTNTPLQALATLNDPQSIEAARSLATTVIQASSEPEVRIDQMARRVLARPLEPAEAVIVAESIRSLRDHYAENAESAAALVAVGQTPVPDGIAADELAAYTMLANQLMNLDEVLNK